tara:strand:+ start:297 stop:530 length:234 start_codon:yes stop_codon:yes gene_type:complete
MVSISDKDKEWLNGHFKKNVLGKTMRGESVFDYLYAEKILRGADKINRRSCGCEYSAVKRKIERLYKEFIDGKEIKG